jgi:hypothetical protein
MRSFVTLFVVSVILIPLEAFADASDDTLRLYLSKSDLVVLGKITTEPLGIAHELGVPNYICQFRIDDVLKGESKLQSKSIKVNIKRFGTDKSDHHPLIKRGSECILFLKKASQSTVPAWVTADFWFGVQPTSPWMARSLKRLAEVTDQKPVDFQDIQFRDGIAYLKSHDHPFTGTAEERYLNGRTKGSYHFMYGRNVGKRILYHKNGQKKFQCDFRDGNTHGIEYLWDEDGNLIRLGSQSHGRGHGAYSWWDKDCQFQFVRVMANGHTIREIHFGEKDVVSDGEYKNSEPWNGTFRDWHFLNGSKVLYHEIRDGRPWNGWFWLPLSGDMPPRPITERGWKRVQFRDGEAVAQQLLDREDESHNSSNSSGRRWLTPADRQRVSDREVSGQTCGTDYPKALPMIIRVSRTQKDPEVCHLKPLALSKEYSPKCR